MPISADVYEQRLAIENLEAALETGCEASITAAQRVCREAGCPSRSIALAGVDPYIFANDFS